MPNSSQCTAVNETPSRYKSMITLLFWMTEMRPTRMKGSPRTKIWRTEERDVIQNEIVLSYEVYLSMGKPITQRVKYTIQRSTVSRLFINSCFNTLQRTSPTSSAMQRRSVSSATRSSDSDGQNISANDVSGPSVPTAARRRLLSIRRGLLGGHTEGAPSASRTSQPLQSTFGQTESPSAVSVWLARSG